MLCLLQWSGDQCSGCGVDGIVNILPFILLPSGSLSLWTARSHLQMKNFLRIMLWRKISHWAQGETWVSLAIMKSLVSYLDLFSLCNVRKTVVLENFWGCMNFMGIYGKFFKECVFEQTIKTAKWIRCSINIESHCLDQAVFSVVWNREIERISSSTKASQTNFQLLTNFESNE